MAKQHNLTINLTNETDNITRRLTARFTKDDIKRKIYQESQEGY